MESKRVILRKLKQSDDLAMFMYAKKPNIGPMAGWIPHKTIEETRDILTLMIKEDEVFGIVLDKENDYIVGTVGLHSRTFFNALANQKELGYVLDDLYWGQGIMVEACNLVLDYAFNDLKLDKVLCGHRFDNLQSKRVIEKLGFIYSHDEERDNHTKDQKIQIMMYELTKYRYEVINFEKPGNKI